MNAITTPDLTDPMHRLGLMATCSKHWRWQRCNDPELLAPLANLNARCRRAWRRGDAVALAWLAEHHRAREQARMTVVAHGDTEVEALVAALEAAP